MQKKKCSQFRRILSLFMCVAMLCTYIVLPVRAETVTEALSSQKFSLNIDNINGYESNEAVITHGNWLSYQADNGNTSLKNFMINEADQYVDLMPAEGKTYWSDAVRETCAKAFYNEDGTVSIVNYYSVAGFNWPYVYTQPELAIDLQLTRWLYFTYESTNYFNVVLDYTYNGAAYSVKPQTADYPVAGSATTYCIDLHTVTGLSSGTIVLKQCKFYTVGNYEGYVKLHNFGLASSEAAAQTYASGGTGTYIDGYTVLMIEYMGSRKDGLSGVDGVEFFVDAVIDCGEDFDEEPHQLKAKTDYGFMLYIPDAVMANLAQKPARGDLVDATFLAYGLSDYSGGTTAAGHTLTFYENPTNTLRYATAADVNATVKLFNYDETVSRDGFNFWNGYWGWGGAIESVDGSGVEDGKLATPYPSIPSVLPAIRSWMTAPAVLMHWIICLTARSPALTAALRWFLP